ncbi:formin-like protein 5 [Amaranthus tricolor]|uniref:formin-like protein 5 n=1 Tax=Amaranthus tricolor TaxID=29722 RepID=UPI00258E49EA|nr:formin-like protein 5 [Amaranthus tricolor]XP_057540336.1 formin-like protein 5 [Amaranthus tricolor]
MVKLLKMQIKDVGISMVFVLLFCSFLGMTLEDRKVIQGILSGLDLNSASEDLNEKLVEVLASSCSLELIHLKQTYKDIGFCNPDASGKRTEKCSIDQTVTEEDVWRVLGILDSQKMKSIINCFRENYIITPISGEDANPVSWFRKHLDYSFLKLNPTADSRRLLAQAPAGPPSPQSAGGKSSGKRKAPPPVDKFFIPIPVLPTKNGGGDSEPVTTTGNGSKNNNHTTIVVAVVVTALVTFVAALCLFLCCRKAFGGGSNLEHKDDRPLLSLSLSEASGSSSKSWAYENSVHKDKMGNQVYMNNVNSETGAMASNVKLSMESSDYMMASAAAINASNVSSNSNTSPALKPPPGRTGLPAPGLPPLKPPPGRAEPLPPERPASLRPFSDPESRPPPPPKPPATAPPPPPKPPAPAPPPPPPGPPPPVGRKGTPGPGAPPLPTPSRPPPIAVKGRSKEDEKAKLKPFHWDKVQANAEHSMVWDQLKSGSFQFNEEMIQSLFGYAATENKNDKKNHSSSRDSQSQFIQLIDQKKAQNLSILLRALNVTTDEVRDALLEGNELPSELLETLLKMAPTPEEELKLRLYNGEISQLGPAERFLKALVDVPFAFRRLKTLLFMGTLQEEATSVKESFIILEAACKELRNSRLFLKLLEAVLKTGNRMNDGTYRGGAQAFKLDTLLKLADVKGTDGKTTLLHFVVQEIIRSEGVRAARAMRESKSFSSIKSDDLSEDVQEDSEEHYRSLGLQVVSGLSDQLENVKKAACLDSDTLVGTLARLGNALLISKNFLKEIKELDEVSGFHEALNCFIEHTEGDVTQLLEEEKKIMALVKSTADYFHGQSGKEEGLRLFVIVRDFIIMLEKACREVKERPRWPTRNQKTREPPSRQTSTETPQTPFSPDFRQKLFPAIAERRTETGFSSDDD